jgi:hypothetical protein
MYLGISSVPKISSGSRLKLKSKKDESRDCSQDREKGMRRRDYSRMVRFFDGRLFSAHRVFPLSSMALGVFPGEAGRVGVKWWKCVWVFAEHQRAILLAVEMHWEWWLASVHWWEYQTAGVSPWMRRVFSTKQCSWFPNGDSLRILRQGARVCAYSARGGIPECVQSDEDSYAQIREVIMKQMQNINFHFYCRNSITPSTN